MSKIIFFLFVLINLGAIAQPKEGQWRGVLLLNKEKNIELPFNFDVRWDGSVKVTIRNASERIVVTETRMVNDSFLFKMPVFDTEFRTKLHDDTLLTGVWINHSKKENNSIPFFASFGNRTRFEMGSAKVGSPFLGKWEVTFSPGTQDSSKAIGRFDSGMNNWLTGTFMTETGDYRYLEGSDYQGKLRLSAFDGSHAFLFVGDIEHNGNIRGVFYSGNSWSEPWIGKRNDAFELRDPEKLTYLKYPNQVIDFSFKNSNEQTVSLSDARFKDKVVIVQIMGSWCPNCMDETAYLAQLYKKYTQKGISRFDSTTEQHERHVIEIIGLAYERTSDPEKAKNNIKRLKERFGVDYEILITGLTGKDKASQSLPFLNGVMAFPTTLILNKEHKVVSVYTGFNGPATGQAYEDYIIKTEKLITSLLKK